jgi:essential nuclear protein 1
MPKVKKIRAPALQKSNPSSTLSGHEQPLGQVIQDDTNRNLYATTKHGTKLTSSSSTSLSKSVKNKDDHEDEDEYYNDRTSRNVTMDEKSSQRIIALSVEQQMEIRQSDLLAATGKVHRPESHHADTSHNKKKSTDDSDDDDDDDDDDKANDANHRTSSNDNCSDYQDYQYADRIGDGEYVDMVDTAMMGISPEDEAIIATMMKGRTPSSTNGPDDTDRPPHQRTLADLIFEKIAQKEQQQQLQLQSNDYTYENEDDAIPQLPPKVIEVYTEIGNILSRYTSGKLPKAFKVIPSLSNWEEVLYITRPDKWTPAAMYAATRIFASNCNVKMATKFYNLILLDSVRHDIHSNKKLNYHYYMSLKKSIYKPQSFFKGILLPLCEENCTLREAAIVASVLQRISIPVHHAAVAIHKLATMHQSTTMSAVLMSEYSGATSIFLKTLLNKKYSLPAPVISSVIQYFTNFLNHTSTTVVLPVLWHQALLVFVQRYKNAITAMDTTNISDTFRKLFKQHYHHKITPEIRRELFGSIQAYQEEQQQIRSKHTVLTTNYVVNTNSGTTGSQPMEM